MRISIINPKDGGSARAYDADDHALVSFIATAADRDFGYPVGGDLLTLAAPSGKKLDRNATIKTACHEGTVYTVASGGSVAVR